MKNYETNGRHMLRYRRSPEILCATRYLVPGTVLSHLVPVVLPSSTVQHLVRYLVPGTWNQVPYYRNSTLVVPGSRFGCQTLGS